MNLCWCTNLGWIETDIFIHTVTKLSKKLVQTEAEMREAVTEAEEIKQKFSDMKHHHESILIENTSKIALEEHVTKVSSFKR